MSKLPAPLLTNEIVDAKKNHTTLEKYFAKAADNQCESWDRDLALMILFLATKCKHLLGGDLGSAEPPRGLAEYVQGFCRKLFQAWRMARENLRDAQGKMKQLYGSKAVVRAFSQGAQVFALLPIPGSPFDRLARL